MRSDLLSLRPLHITTVGCNANRPRNDNVQTDNFRFDKTEKQQEYLTTKPTIKGNFAWTDLRDKKE